MERSHFIWKECILNYSQWTHFKLLWIVYWYSTRLTHWGRVTHICVNKLTIISSDNGLSPSHYLNQCWEIVVWTTRNLLKWNPNRNPYIFIQENAFENVVWEMAAILSRPQYVNGRCHEIMININPKRLFSFSFVIYHKNISINQISI